MSSESQKLEIVLAVYQGERGGYLDQQLETLFAQSNQDWQLLVRDNASSDGTLDILRRWCDRHPDRVTILDEDAPRQLGLSGNFSRLLEATCVPHVMLCDHDDLWYPDKVERAISAMQVLEAQFGPDVPLISCTDQRAVDQNLKEIAPSYWGLLGFAPDRGFAFGRVCVHPAISSPTIILNQALIRRACPIPPEAMAHDRWLEVVAAAFGHIEARNEISVDYRRHTTNTTALPPSTAQILGEMARNLLTWRNEYWARREPNLRMMRVFLNRYKDSLASPVRDAAAAISSFRDLGFWGRRQAILRHRFFYHSPWYTLAFLVLA